MTVEEFSNEFDTLLSSYSTRVSYGYSPDFLEFDEYEKSVFLTKAQEELVIESYTGKSITGESFEKTEEFRRYLSDLVNTKVLTDKLTEHVGLSKSSVFFELPDNVWFITYESVTLKDEKLGCSDGEEVIVIPITQDEFFRISKNPFRKPSKDKAIRLDIKDGIVEIVSNYNIEKYLVRYVEKPLPIILVDLQDLSINGIKVKTECKLNPVIHREILERAVRLAIISKTQVSGNKKE